MKGVILAAGFGGRLRPLTLSTPKVLLEIGGQSLISYPLQAMRAAGIDDIGVVVGYRADEVSEYVQDLYPGVTIIHNEHYDGGNAISIYAAREFVSDEPFVLCMGDHPICSDFIADKLPGLDGGCTLYVDPMASHPSQVNDGTRVMVSSGGYVVTIGKELDRWNATDTGVFKMDSDLFGEIETLMATKLLDVSLTDVVRNRTSQGNPFFTCDVGGMFWADVDTLEDYLAVNDLLCE